MGVYTKHYSHGTSVHIYEFDPKYERLAYEFGENMKLEQLHKLQRPRAAEQRAAALNWNFFDWVSCFNGYGEIEQDGVQKQAPSIHFPSFSFKQQILTIGDLQDAQVGAGYGATLILDGKKNVTTKATISLSIKDARSAIAQKPNGIVGLIAVIGDDRKRLGMNAYELADFLLSLGYHTAFMGDGGGSVSFMLGDVYKYNQYRAIACGFVTYKYRVIRYGAKGAAVEYLQQRLIELGYDLGRWGADGDFGRLTHKAVIDFQLDHGLVMDGIVGNNTWYMLSLS